METDYNQEPFVDTLLEGELNNVISYRKEVFAMGCKKGGCGGGKKR